MTWCINVVTSGVRDEYGPNSKTEERLSFQPFGLGLWWSAWQQCPFSCSIISWIPTKRVYILSVYNLKRFNREKGDKKHCCIRQPRASQTYSMGDLSCEYAGHARTLVFSFQELASIGINLWATCQLHTPSKLAASVTLCYVIKLHILRLS